MKYEPFIPRHKGKKISLCPAKADDDMLAFYMGYICDESINSYIQHNYRSPSFKDEKAFMENITGWHYNIVINETHEIIGTCQLSPTRGGRVYNFGIAIANGKDRNKGYGTEAIYLLQRFAYRQLDAIKIELSVLAHNERARACYKKMGFTECGAWHKACFVDGEYIDLIMMENFKETFETINSPFAEV